MDRYKTSHPRGAFAIAAVAMTAITIGLMVVVPAKMDSGSQEAHALAQQGAATLATATAVVNPPCIDVAANRKPTVDSVQVGNDHPKHKRQG